MQPKSKMRGQWRKRHKQETLSDKYKGGERKAV